MTFMTHAYTRQNDAFQAADVGRKETLFVLPFGKDNHFVGREDIISNIDRNLETEQRSSYRHRRCRVSLDIITRKIH